MHRARLSERLISPSVTAANSPAAPRFSTSVSPLERERRMSSRDCEAEKKESYADTEHSSPRTFFKAAKRVVPVLRYFRRRRYADIKNVIKRWSILDEDGQLADGPLEIQSPGSGIHSSRVQQRARNFSSSGFSIYTISSSDKSGDLGAPIILRAVLG